MESKKKKKGYEEPRGRTGIKTQTQLVGSSYTAQLSAL